MGDVVPPEDGVSASFRSEVVRKQRVFVVDEERDRILHALRFQKRADGVVAVLLVSRFVCFDFPVRLTEALCLPAAAARKSVSDLRRTQCVSRAYP